MINRRTHLSRNLQKVFLVFLALLSVLVFSTIAVGQTDVNINDLDLLQIGGDVIVPAGKTIDNATAIGGDVTIGNGARVTRTAIAVGGDVILENNARVDGDAYSIGGSIVRGNGATIAGSSRAFSEQGRWDIAGSRQRGRNGFLEFYLSNLASHLLIVLLSGIVGVWLLQWRPRFLRDLADTARQYPVQCLLSGLGGIVAVMLLAIVLVITIIGIFLLPVVGFTYLAVVMVGTLGVALWIGEKARTETETPIVRQFLTGLLVLFLIGLVPWLGGLILTALNVIGLGAVLLWFLNRQRPRPA
jgi:hypothetical protein